MSFQHIERTFPEGINGLCDLPHEILAQIIEHCVVDEYPIVDPRGWMCVDDDKIHPHARLPGKHNCPRDSRSRSAIMTVREMAGLRKNASVHSTGTSSSILAVNKLCNEIGRKLLYEQNTFLFTSMESVGCFVENCNTDVFRVREIVFVVDIKQGPAEHAFGLDRLRLSEDGFSPYPHGPWYSYTVHQPKFMNTFKRRNESHPIDKQLRCPFPSLTSLTLHFRNWRQMELVDTNGTITNEPATASYLTTGERVRNMPELEDMKLVLRPTHPVCLSQPLDIHHGIKYLIYAGWVAKRVVLSGLEEAEEYPVLNDKLKEWMARQEEAPAQTWGRALNRNLE